MINKPTSAGISYGLSHRCNDLKLVVVFDFGGGTLDVSLLTIKDNDFTVIASEGDMFLGGRNFDDKIVDYLIKENNLEKICKNPKYMEILRENAIKIKEDLSETDETDETFDLDDKEVDVQLSVDKFEEITKDLIHRILFPIDRLLISAKKDKESIDQILLVGGSSGMKFVKRKLANYFGKEPFFDIHSRTAIARRAAYVASNFSYEEENKKIIEEDKLEEEEEEECNDKKSKIDDDDDSNSNDDDSDNNSNDDGDDNDNDTIKVSINKKYKKTREGKVTDSFFKTFKYQDICPFSIGTLTYGGKFCSIIPKGKEIPVKMQETFQTLFYRQDSFKVHIFQGLSDKIENNYYLGYFSVDGIPISDNPIEFEVILELKRNGILYATASTKNSSVLQQKELKVRKIKNGINPRNHGFKDEDEDEEVMEKKLILKNIKRFIKFNYDAILNSHIYSSNIDNALERIKFFKKNLDSDDTPEFADQLISYFSSILKKYLKTLPPNEVPNFLNANT